ncbi:hypothetical protein INT43_001464 [Umbelopsis isabellina]|uniref:Golgi to ER traffic protein 4 n=1 Tax=Mortierella isabellina TaxID=91625 RepID=A0A8H7PDM8_MORIS|nr:hypothetical protein INT43_001464 [Umbelopsis isabellina]
MSSKGTEKTLQKLKQSVEDGNYYEAHQMYRTVARRLTKQQKYRDVIDLLHSGAASLLKQKQSGSGSDLALYMLDTYKLSNTPVTEESLDRVVELLELYPADEPGRKTFINSAISWSQKNGDSEMGDPDLHNFAGTLLYHNKQYNEAEKHLLFGSEESGKLLGDVEYDWAVEIDSADKGTFIARAVLQLLAMKNIHYANLAFQAFTKRLDASEALGEAPYRPAPADQSINITIYKDSLINFSQLLILTAQRDAGELFKTLKSKYAPAFAQDSKFDFDEALADFGLSFFNIQKPRNQGNVLQDLMSSLFSGGGGPANTGAKRVGGPGQGSSGTELD